MKVYVSVDHDPMESFDKAPYGDALHFDWGQHMSDGSWLGIARVTRSEALALLRAEPSVMVFPNPLAPTKITEAHAKRLAHIGAKAGQAMYDVAKALLDAHGYHGFDPDAP